MMEFLEMVPKSAALAAFVGEYSWVWPICEILHFFGMTLLVGAVGLLDLRMLGVAKGLPPAALHRLIPWAILGFGINLSTGILFIFGDPFKDPAVHFQNITFVLKMLFIMLAGINALTFYALGARALIENLGAGDDAPRRAKVIAATSLVLWVGVIYLGRMLPYTDAFYFALYW